MKNYIRHIKIIIYACFFSIILSTNSTNAENSFDLSGRWHITLEDGIYLMDLTQQGIEFSGTMKSLTNNLNLDSSVLGTIHGEIIQLTSSNKDLSVVRRMKGEVIQRGTNAALKGSYNQNGRYFQYWHALR